MRPELNTFEKIDLYLAGQLTASEKETFENQIKTDQNLAQLVAEQQLLIQAVQRKAIKADILKYGGSKGFNWMNAGLISVVIIAFSLAAYFFFSPTPTAVTPKKASIEKAPKNIEKVQPESNRTEETCIIDSTQIEKDTSSFNSKNKQFVETWIDHKEDTKCGGHPTFVAPKVQHFNVRPKTSTTLKGKEGMVIFIPENAFIDENGNNITTDVNIELVEALTLKEMLFYDLPTLSNDKLLESGGMFYINATSEGKIVKVNPERPYYIQVPTDSLRPNMRVVNGEVLADGSINWVDPKSMKKYLTKLPLKDLNFLPEGFEEAVTKVLPINKHTSNNKELTDSLYYSLLNENSVDDEPQNWGDKLTDDTVTEVKKSKIGLTKRLLKRMPTLGSKESTENQPINNAAVTESTNINQPNCGLDPSAVKAIRQKDFENTYVATQEFEERIFWMHQLENGQDILNLYIDNLDKDLSFSDSLAMKQIADKSIKAKFTNFYNQHCTTIKDAEMYNNELSTYYKQKRKEYQKEAKKLNQQLEQKNSAELKAIQQEINTKIAEIKATNEYNVSTSNNQFSSKANKVSLNIPSIRISKKHQESAPTPTYSFNWSDNGWANIDQYIHLLSKQPNENQLVQIEVNEANNYDLCKSYQWLNEINTLNPVRMFDGKGSIPFPAESSKKSKNMRKTYNFVLAKKGEDLYFQYSQFDPYITNAIVSSPRKISKEELEGTLENIGAKNIQAINHFDQAYQSIEAAIKRKEKMDRLLEEQKALQAEQNKIIQKQMEVQNKINLLKSVAFKCFDTISTIDTPIDEINSTEPKFIANNGDLNGYIMNQLKRTKRPTAFSSEVNFTVDEKGQVQNVSVDSKEDLPVYFINFLKDIFENMPAWQPATENGKPVSIEMTLPLGAKGG